MKRFLLLCLSACLLAACAPAPIRGATYVLRPEQSVDLERGLRLTYDSYSDSRCPPNARCVWAGRLIFRFVLHGPEGAEEFALGPDHPAAAPAALHGVRVALDPAAIPPARGGGNRTGDVVPVTVKIVPL
jgi:hypothetical protein